MWIDELRKMKTASGLTTKDIADQSGIAEPTLEKIFSGATKNPKLTTIQQLVHFLGYTLDDLTPEHKSTVESLSGDETKLIRCFRQFSSYEQAAILHFACRLASEANQQQIETTKGEQEKIAADMARDIENIVAQSKHSQLLHREVAE